jgi:hypothetical protein
MLCEVIIINFNFYDTLRCNHANRSQKQLNPLLKFVFFTLIFILKKFNLKFFHIIKSNILF